MQYLRAGLGSSLSIAMLLVSSTLCAQQAAKPAAAPPPPAAAPPPAPASLSQSLGVVVFPAKNQSAATQSSDEGYCYGWAKTNTGIDPMAPPPTQAAAVAPPPPDPGGQRVAGAARGAAGGAVIGAIAGDAGQGAAIGAAAGAMHGGAQKRRGNLPQRAQSCRTEDAACVLKFGMDSAECCLQLLVGRRKRDRHEGNRDLCGAVFSFFHFHKLSTVERKK